RPTSRSVDGVRVAEGTVQSRLAGKEATRQRIVEAAIEVFAEVGYHDAGVDDIVRRSGTSKGAFYFHFPSKEEIFFALVDALAGRMASSVEQAIASESRGMAKVEAALAAVFSTLSRHRKLAKILLVSAAGLGRTTDERFIAQRQRFAALIKGYLDQAVADGSIPAQDTELAAYAWLGAVNEVVVRWLYIPLDGKPLESALPALRTLLLRSVGDRRVNGG
ncbi:MAG: TetR/AcrR family transcriptional regulator, partial [Chloroflexota bacterium]|nr:TetR/AcrR family transcriptional regulator [Chloroflexota bacterium]